MSRKFFFGIILISLSLTYIKSYYSDNIIRNLISNESTTNLQLNYEGLGNQKGWEKVGIALPSYDVKKLAEKTRKNPIWVHFGICNIFRLFIGGIADELISSHNLDKGIICVESFDYEVVDKIYKPFDNLAVGITLHVDGKQDKRIIGSLSEAIKAPNDIARLKEIFRNPSLQLISFTITEKGYALQDSKGNYFGFVKNDIENGPEKPIGTIAIIVSLLFERFKAGKYPLAIVSMDNVSQNGKKLENSVFEIAEKWLEKRYVDNNFIDYIKNDKIISFPWTMIDKITPRPREDIAESLEKLGIENMKIIITDKKTFIALLLMPKLLNIL